MGKQRQRQTFVLSKFHIAISSFISAVKLACSSRASGRQTVATDFYMFVLLAVVPRWLRISRTSKERKCTLTFFRGNISCMYYLPLTRGGNFDFAACVYLRWISIAEKESSSSFFNVLPAFLRRNAGSNSPVTLCFGLFENDPIIELPSL